MSNCKPVITLMSQQFKLSVDQAPKTHEEEIYMEGIPYANAVGSLMYAMVGDGVQARKLYVWGRSAVI